MNMLHFYAALSVVSNYTASQHGEIHMYCREVLHVFLVFCFAKTYTLNTVQYSGLSKISRDDHMITACTVSYNHYATSFLILPKKSSSKQWSAAGVFFTSSEMNDVICIQVNSIWYILAIFKYIDRYGHVDWSNPVFSARIQWTLRAPLKVARGSLSNEKFLTLR